MIDNLTPRLQVLLEDVRDQLAAADAAVVRWFLAPGASPPWDDCCATTGGREGQAWVALTRFYPAGPFPAQDTGAARCDPSEYAADITVGVLRCARTVDDKGNPPTGGKVTDDAVKVGRDRHLVLAAILCGGLLADDDPGSFRLGGWTPLGPQGGCVGGAWTFTLAVPPCPCP